MGSFPIILKITVNLTGIVWGIFNIGWKFFLNRTICKQAQ